MKRTIIILTCLGTLLLAASAFAKSDDQNEFKIQATVTDAVYGKK